VSGLLRALVALLLLTLAAGAMPARAEQRIALIVANESYASGDLGRLPGTRTDAQRLEIALKKDGFAVTTVYNAGLGQMRQAVGAFARRLAQAGKDGVGFFYYSGHGIASEAGQDNYLIPVDAVPQGFTDLPLQAFGMKDMIGAVAAAGAKAAFIVIDACRNTPVSWSRGTKGLLRPDPSTDMLIAYATAPQSTASDDGLYSQILSEELSKEGANSDLLFQAVQRRVARETNRRQIPAFESRLVEPVVFLESLPTETLRRAVPATTVALPTDSPAIASLRQRALAGDAASQVSLGIKYDGGRDGLARNKTEAVRFFRMASDRGDALGQGFLADMYQFGEGGLAVDKVEAVRLYKLAADQGNRFAQARLGRLYELGGGGLVVNRAQAARLYKLAADQGEPMAQARLGYMYDVSLGGLPKDQVEAVRLYKLAADQGNALAQVNLGVLYELGQGGLPVDKMAAARLFRLAADQGDADGQAYLADYYSRGDGGLPKDSAESLRFFKLAAQKGNDYAQKRLRSLGESW
jgi:TPR repeat protein